MKKKAIIIGAGIAGLTVGIHLQRNSYDTEIFELHTLPGGLCTAENACPIAAAHEKTFLTNHIPSSYTSPK